MSQSTNSAIPSTAAKADVSSGTDFFMDLLPVLSVVVGSMGPIDARTRFWLGFASGLAGFIAADLSPEAAKVVMHATINALDGAKLGNKQSVH